MGEVTQINPNLQETATGGSNSTVINPELLNNTASQINNGSNVTFINSALNTVSTIENGTVLCDSFVVDHKLDTVTGEADLYLCRKYNAEYVAKVYRRKVAVKEEIIQKLIGINSSNVAKVYATGEYNGYPVEVIPYYKNGSLQGRTYSYIELKKHIIPSLNEGLHVLHENGIIHKDLKPSNIMLNDNNVDVAIIDFGISSVRESNSTVIVTQTGMTPEYSAPETFKSLFLSESDYYSFGITIFELFCGHTPYTNMSADDIEKYVSVQRIPFPEDMPEDLKDLISALTYYDITNRKNKANPNRRWGYEEVKRWCNGEKQIVPGMANGNSGSVSEIPPYKFLGETYNTRASLVRALGKNWSEGKKQLFRGLLSTFFKPFDPECASYCMDAEEESSRSNDSTDLIFFRTLYKLDPDMTCLFWQGWEHESLVALGDFVLECLWKNDTTLTVYYDSILENKILTTYAKAVGNKDPNIFNALNGLEMTYLNLGKTTENKVRVYYLMAYMLSGKRILNIRGQKFQNIDELAMYMDKLLLESYSSFDDFCHLLLSEKGDLYPPFESWLISIGKQGTIQNWRKGLK